MVTFYAFGGVIMKKLCHVFILILGILTTILVVDEFNEDYYNNVTLMSELMRKQVSENSSSTSLSASSQGLTLDELMDKIINFADSAENRYFSTDTLV